MQRCDAGTMLRGDSMSLEEPASESGSLPQMGLREILFFFFLFCGVCRGELLCPDLGNTLLEK